MPGKTSRYMQVGRTYAARPEFRWLAVITFAYLCFTLANYDYATSLPVEWRMSLEPFVYITPLFLLVALVATLMMHVREQLSGWPARLTPGFRRPHLLVAFLVYLGLAALSWAFIYVPIKMDPASSSFVLGVWAIVLTLMTLSSWWATIGTAWTALLLVPLAIIAIQADRHVQQLLELVIPIRSPMRGRVAAWLVVANAVATLLLAWRVARWGRGDPEERLGTLFDREGASTQSPRSTRPHMAHQAVTHFWSRAWHRRLPVLGRGAAWVLGAVVLVAVTVGPRIVLGWSAREPAQDLVIAFLLSAVAPGVAVGAIWWQRRATLGYESLFPATRPRFAMEIAWALAEDLAEYWLIITLAVMIPVLLLQPGALRATFASSLASLLASALMQVFAWGTILCAARSSAWWARAGMQAALILAATIPMAAAWSHQRPLTPSGLIVISLFETVVGAALVAVGKASLSRASFA